MKKLIKLISIPAAVLLLAACSNGVVPTETSVPSNTPSTGDTTPTETSASSNTPSTSVTDPATGTSTTAEASTSQIPEDPSGVAITSDYNSTILDYTSYENTDSYKVVTTPKEFLDALYQAKFEYTNTVVSVNENDGYVVRNNTRKNATNWNAAITKGLYIKNPEDGTYVKIPSDTPYDPDDTKYTASMTYYEDSPYSTVSINQTTTKQGSVRVIEIANDLDLGYNLIKDLDVNTSTFENWDKSKRLEGSTDVYTDPDIKAAGISKIKVNNTSNLVIYSKNGSKLTHCGFDVSSCYNVSFRNLEMDEIWMWEDSTSASPTIKVGDYDSFGWAYFKVSFSQGVWIDHCTFGKSFDGQIDYSNPYYNSMGTYQKAPLGANGNNGLNVTFCDFKAGSSDHDGYLYKMMDRIEQEYQVYASNKSGYTYTKSSCRYYFTLRDKGLSFEDILYGIAIPQKKAFLWGDSGDSYKYNKYLQATLSSCTITNIEDRLPKVRGGMAYVYNVLVDNTDYLPYVSTLKAVQSAVQGANSKYKLGAVSQGILAGLDASVYLESVVYRGISSYLKNNDSSPSEDKAYPTVNGGYMIKNSIIGGIAGSTTDNPETFEPVNASSNLSTEYFAFKVNGKKTDLTTPPFTINGYDVVGNGSIDNYFEQNPTGVQKNKSTTYWLTAYVA